MARRVGRTLQCRLRTTNPSNDLTTAPQQGQPRTSVEEPGHTGGSLTAQSRTPAQKRTHPLANTSPVDRG